MVDLACDVALEAADDVAAGFGFGAAAIEVVAGGLVPVQAAQGGAVERGLGVAVAAAVNPVAGGLPEEACRGLTPRRAAKEASLCSRGCRRRRVSRVAALSGPMPYRVSRAGVWRVTTVVAASAAGDLGRSADLDHLIIGRTGCRT